MGAFDGLYPGSFRQRTCWGDCDCDGYSGCGEIITLTTEIPSSKSVIPPQPEVDTNAVYVMKGLLFKLETPKAMLWFMENYSLEEVWLPKKEILEFSKIDNFVTIPGWLFERKLKDHPNLIHEASIRG